MSSRPVPRDPRLRGLSSEHHAALVWARRLRRREDQEPIGPRFARELEPHFAVEEEVLVPALLAIGAREIVARLRDEHHLLRALAAADDAPAFARALHHHVRFEERVLFPLCEQRLPAAILDQVARRSPKA